MCALFPAAATISPGELAYGGLLKPPDLAESLVSTVQQLRQAQEQTTKPAYSVRSTLSTRQWRVGDRLSEADLEQLIAVFTSGTSKRNLPSATASARVASSGSSDSTGRPSHRAGYAALSVCAGSGDRRNYRELECSGFRVGWTKQRRIKSGNFGFNAQT